MREQSAFEVWMRTGWGPTAEPVEAKFNPWHDPDDGRFTFANQGRYFGRGGSTPASANARNAAAGRSVAERTRALRRRARAEAAAAAERARVIRERRERDAFKTYMADARREGDRDAVYRDHLGNMTVGIGHLVTPADSLRDGERITPERKEALWRADANRALHAARHQMRDAGIADPNFLFPLASVNFQLDTDWHQQHRKTWALIKRRQYAAAAREVLNSRWAAQTPKRVREFSDALLKLEQAEQIRRGRTGAFP